MTNKQTPPNRGRPFSQDIDLDAIAEIRLDKRQVGTFILGNGKSDRPDQLQCVFGFETNGFHSELSADQAVHLIQGLAEGLANLPQGTRLTVYSSLFADDKSRQAELDKLLGQTADPLTRLEVYSHKARVQQLTDQGRRQVSTLHLFITGSPDSVDGMSRSHIEKAASSLNRLARHLQPAIDSSGKVDELRDILTRAYSDVYLPTENLLTVRMGIDVRPMPAQGLWQASQRRFQRHGATSETPSQLLVLDESGLREHIHNQRHPRVILTKPFLPEASEAFVKLGHRDYVGIVTLVDKPSGWSDPQEQLRAMFKVQSQPGVKDTEFIAEFSVADPQLQSSSLQLLNRQANTSAAFAAEQYATDVRAAFNADQSVEAQHALLQGAIPIKVAFVAIVHRPTARALNNACNRLISYFPGTAWVAREPHIAYRRWTESLPVSNQPLLVWGAFDQRTLFFNDEAVGFMPLVMPKPHDSRGFELLSAEGGVPIYLDFYDKPRALLCLATSRAGKSVMVAQIIIQALTRGMPVTIIDYPRADGTSTFTDPTRLLGGAYFDITKQDNNLLEIPDIWQFQSIEEQQDRLQAFQLFLRSALMQLIVGDSGPTDLPASRDSIKSVLDLALSEFFNDASIMTRYRNAYRSGFGSSDWQRMPALADFNHLLQNQTLALSTDEGIRATQHIHLRLQSWINSPGIGRAISRPSTVRNDAQLTVIACTNLADEGDAAVVAMMAHAMALRRSLTAPSSILLADESPILFQSAEVSKAFGRLCASGLKAGIHPILLAQDPDTIAQSAAGAQILQNLNTRLIGRIQPTAITSFERILGYPRDLISRNAAETFFLNPQELYSNWLLDDGGTFTRCRFYPSPILLALTANNPSEQSARQAVMERFSERPLEGIATFSRLLVQAIQSGDDLDAIVAAWQCHSA